MDRDASRSGPTRGSEGVPGLPGRGIIPSRATESPVVGEDSLELALRCSLEEERGISYGQIEADVGVGRIRVQPVDDADVGGEVGARRDLAELAEQLGPGGRAGYVVGDRFRRGQETCQLSSVEFG